MYSTLGDQSKRHGFYYGVIYYRTWINPRCPYKFNTKGITLKGFSTANERDDGIYIPSYICS